MPRWRYDARGHSGRPARDDSCGISGRLFDRRALDRLLVDADADALKR
jgi:hypothetical protein